MGGRGASSGVSVKGKAYGTEYATLYQSGNIKFVRYNDGAATAPMETKTKGRVYVTVNEKNGKRPVQKDYLQCTGLRQYRCGNL